MLPQPVQGQQWRCKNNVKSLQIYSSISIVNCEQISVINMVFPLLTLSNEIPAMTSSHHNKHFPGLGNWNSYQELFVNAY